DYRHLLSFPTRRSSDLEAHSLEHFDTAEGLVHILDSQHLAVPGPRNSLPGHHTPAAAWRRRRSRSIRWSVRRASGMVSMMNRRRSEEHTSELQSPDHLV